MAVGCRRPRDTQACMQGATRRTRTLRLGVGRRCVTLGISRPAGPVAGPPCQWALHAKLGSESLDSSRGALAALADFGREMSLARS